MTCEHCCGAESIFDKKGAEKQLIKYSKKGADKPSKILIKGISKVMNGAESVLDIGGGIGAVHLELLESGLNKATDVDASQAYIETAKKNAESKSQKEKVSYIHGDFLDHSNDIEKHDVVVLDKVICCYPHLDDLLNKGLGRTNKVYALVYPKSSFIGKLFVKFGNLYFKFKKNPFRSFIHDQHIVRKTILSDGFFLASRRSTFVWNIEVYSRN